MKQERIETTVSKLNRIMVIALSGLVLFAILSWFLGKNLPQKPIDAPTWNEIHEEVEQMAFRQEDSPSLPTGRSLKLSQWGRKLFFSPRLSKSGEISCASCHQPQHSFTDGRPLAIGMAQGTRNTPTIINSFSAHWFFWDGRADSLEAQAIKPIEAEAEHGFSRIEFAQLILSEFRQDYEKLFPIPRLDWLNLPPSSPSLPPVALSLEVGAYTLATIGHFPTLDKLLNSAYVERVAPARLLNRFLNLSQEEETAFDLLRERRKSSINKVVTNALKAIASYQKTVIAVDSPLDTLIRRSRPGRLSKQAFVESLGPEALAGLQVFMGNGRCILCHNGPLLSDQQFHNIGLPHVDGKNLDLGRAVGVLRVLSDPLNCASQRFAPSSSEACQELAFLDVENIELVGAFKTPTLRNLADTAPYMHDGRFATIREVLEHYRSSNTKPAVGHREETLDSISLSDKDMDHLESFLSTLQSEVRDLTFEASQLKTSRR